MKVLNYDESKKKHETMITSDLIGNIIGIYLKSHTDVWDSFYRDV
jgi:hypothetical protein